MIRDYIRSNEKPTLYSILRCEGFNSIVGFNEIFKYLIS